MPRILTRLHRALSDSRGFTLVELMSVIVSMGVLMGVSVAVFKHSTQAGMRLESGDNLKNFGQQAVNSVRLQLSQSRVIYQNDSYGAGLWARLQFPSGRAPISSSTLPAIQALGSLSPSEAEDPDTPFDPAQVGNSLLFVESAGHVKASTRWVDVYRLRAYYVAKDTSIDMSHHGCGYDLLEFEGRQYADYTSLVGAPAAVYQALIAQGFTQAWNSLGTSVGTTVYTLNAAGTMTAQASPNIQPRRVQSATHLFGTRGDTHYAVAFNRSTTFAIADSVPAFATADASGDGFPNGFEVMVVGPTGGRKILTRLVMVAEGYGGRYSQAFISLAQAKNY
jgi:type II secretory pathway pseudopilin PulG